MALNLETAPCSPNGDRASLNTENFSVHLQVLQGTRSTDPTKVFKYLLTQLSTAMHIPESFTTKVPKKEKCQQGYKRSIYGQPK